MVVESVQVKDKLHMVNYPRPATDILPKQQTSHSPKVEGTYILPKLKLNVNTNGPYGKKFKVLRTPMNYIGFRVTL